jgi:hypothetical protein
MMHSPNSLIFLHIPKAAGTTLQQIIERQYPTEANYTFGASATESVAAFKALPEEKRHAIRVLKGHMGFGLHTYLREPSTYITFLRHPVSRYISYYHHVLRSPVHYLYEEKRMPRNTSLEAFVRGQFTIELNNGQTRLLAGEDGLWQETPFGEWPPDMLEKAKANLDAFFSVVGVAERFDESLLLLQRRLGWRNILYARENVAPQTTAVLPPNLRQEIERQNELDLALYRYAQSRLEAEIKRQGLRFQLLLRLFRRQNRRFQQRLDGASQQHA